MVQAFSQPTPTKINLHGSVKDTNNQVLLANASIAIQQLGKEVRKVQKINSNTNGEFSLQLIKGQVYQVTTSYIGYANSTKLISTDSLSINSALVIWLSPAAATLQTVAVIGKKPVIENKPDKLVYNVDRDVTSQSGTAIDVLRKVPQVTVDIDGNVELLGNPSVRFLINGKTSLSFGSSLADALQTIPSSQIQTIEVISSPGAKYDASGTGGIINIVLKKNRLQGISGMVSATAGTRQENGSTNLHYKKNKLALSGYLGGSTTLTSTSLSESERTTQNSITGNKSILLQNGSGNYKRNGNRGGLSLDWDINKMENLSISWSHNSFGSSNDGWASQNYSNWSTNGQQLGEEKTLRTVATRFRNGENEGSIDYTRKFKKEDKQLKIAYNYGGEDNFTAYNQNNRAAANLPIIYGSKSENPGKLHLSEFNLDFTNPLSKKITLETGVKASIETIESNSDVYTYSLSKQDFVLDPLQSYRSKFTRQVYSAYVSGSFRLLNFLDVVAGTRLEHTLNKTDYSLNRSVKIPDYNNLGPDIIISHQFANEQQLKLSYSYRLERPEYRDLNPFINLSDPHNISTGNPLIKPEIGNDFQLGYNRPLGSNNNLNVVLVFTHNNPDIKSYTTFYPTYKIGDSLYKDVNVTMRDNIAAETRWGLNLSASINSIPHLGIRMNVQLYERTTKNIHATPIYNSGFEYRSNLNATWQISKKLVAEAFGNYNSGIYWQGRRAPFYSYNMAVKKQVLAGKGSIGITAANAFGKYLVQKTLIAGAAFSGYSLVRVPYRSFGINFQYRFGKLKISKPKEEENYLSKPPSEGQ